MTGGLWDFALDFYGRPGVANACLTLQDEAGVDVIMLITAVYADRQGVPLGLDAIGGLQQEMRAWRQEVVLPLRSARRFLRTPLGDHEAQKEELRSVVKKVELAAEKLQFALAASWLQRREPDIGLPLRDVIVRIMDRKATGSLPDDAVEAAISVILGSRF